MYFLILIGYSPYIHVKGSLEKNLSLYLSIGAWFMISLVIQVYIKFDKPKYFSQALSLEYVRQIGWSLSLFDSGKFLFLYSDAWKYICHYLTMASHSSFLLNSHNILLRNIRSIFMCFDFVSNRRCGDYLMLSG